MPSFMDVHSDMKGITNEQLREAHQKDLDVEKEHGVHFVKAWADPASGKVFCLAEGPDKESVMRVHERAGHPTSEIYPLGLTVE